MANLGTTALGKKIDLSREVEGFLPIGNLDPLVQHDVTDGYNLGSTTDGLAVLEGKDASNQLAFYRLSPGPGVTIQQKGNSLVVTSTVLSGGTAGVMLTTTYDTNDNGIVDNAETAESVSWSGITGVPTSFPPAHHTHPESDITNLSSDLAAKVPNTRVINTAFSLQGGGPLSADLTLSLIGDKANVGPDMRYGTDPTGNLGWYPASVGAGDMTQAVYDKNSNGIVDLSEGVIPGGVTGAMIAPGAVTGTKIASYAIPGTALAPTAVIDSLGYYPVVRSGDTMTGSLIINKTGPGTTTPGMYTNAHLLIETNGTGAGYPTLALACLTGGVNQGAVTLWYQGAHNDIQLEYGDGTAAHILSSISSISGAQFTAGSVPAAALASGAAQANLGFNPVNGTSGGTYTPSGAINFQTSQGLGASSWSVAPLRISAPGGGGTRPQIGFYYPGTAASLYFEPTDVSMRFIDSGGTARLLLDSGHGSGPIINALGFTPLNKGGDTVTDSNMIFSSWAGPSAQTWYLTCARFQGRTNQDPGARAGFGLENAGVNAGFFYLENNYTLRFIADTGHCFELAGSWIF